MSQLDRGQKSRILYVEKKSGHSDDGPAWVGRVRFSRSGRTLYCRDLKLQRIRGGGAFSNYFDVPTGDEYWVSGIKKNGADRHWAGHGAVHVDEDVEEEYRQILQSRP